MCDVNEKLLHDLEKRYTKPGDKLFYSGVNQVYNHYQGCLKVSDIEEFFTKNLASTLHREIPRSKQNPTYVRF